MAENIPNLKWETDIQIEEAQRASNMLNPNRPTLRYITIKKMVKVKDKARILQAAREKQRVNYKGLPIRLSAYFSTEMLQAKREWQDTFKVLKGKN